MVAGDPRRGQRGDTQRSRQKFVTDLRRRQRIRPQPCPDRWVWHRGDDLTGFDEGDEVRFWADRTDGNRHMDDWLDESGTDYPLYTADAMDNKPGIQHTINGDILSANYSDNIAEFTDMAIMLVARPPIDNTVAFRCQPSDTSKHNFEALIGQSSIDVRIAGGFIGADPIDLADDVSLIVVQDPTEIRAWVNGNELIPDDGWYEPPEGNVESFRHSVELNVFDGEARVPELAIWDQKLSDSCVAQQHNYLAGRYPSLGI